MIADFIKKMMKEKRITQLEIARSLGLSTSGFSLFLNGKTGMRQDKIEKVFSLLGIKLVSESRSIRQDEIEKAFSLLGIKLISESRSIRQDEIEKAFSLLGITIENNEQNER